MNRSLAGRDRRLTAHGGGIARLVAAFQPSASKAILLIIGAVTLLLMVFSRSPISALWYFGVMLVIQLILDGLTTTPSGRVRAAEPGGAATPVV